MGDRRKGPRERNHRRKRMFKSIKPIVTTFVIIICLFLAMITYKAYEQSLIMSFEQNEQERKDVELYLLFQEVDRAAENLLSGVVEEDYIEGAEDITIKIVSVGDILCENAIYEDAYNKETGEYDFSHMFSDVKKYTLNSDITLGLLETNFTDSHRYSGQGKYNSPKAFGQALRDIGISVLHTANNHSLDYGFEGLKSTLDYLDEIGIDTVGTYRSEEEADKLLIKDVQGIQLAFLSYTYGINGDLEQVSESSFCINIIDKEKIKTDIEKAKAEGVDFIFVHMHWGDVDSSRPNQEQKDLADFLFKNGVDFVLGSHPASLQQMEVRQNAQGKNTFIAYSTGNFISASKYTNSHIEMILNIEVTKDVRTGTTRLTRVEYVPIYLLDNGRTAKERYKLLDIKEEIRKYEAGETEKITEKTYNSLKEALNKIERLTGKEE